MLLRLPEIPPPGAGRPAEDRFLRRAFRHHSRTFSLATRLLPAPVRLPVATVYLYCRTVDSVADDLVRTAGAARALAEIARMEAALAATLAGTPAHLLVHDSRTLEVAQYHHLPHTLIERIHEVGSVTDLVAQQDYSRFNTAYPELFSRFTCFLGRNGLPNAYTGSGAALAAFDASTETAARARGVLSDTRSAPTLRQVLGRVRRSLTGRR